MKYCCPIFVFMFVCSFALMVHPLDYEIVSNGEFGPRQTVLIVAKQRFFFTKKGFGLFQSYLLELKVYLHRRPYLLIMITWDSLTVCFLQLIKWNNPSLTGTVLATWQIWGQFVPFRPVYPECKGGCLEASMTSLEQSSHHH